MAGLHAYYRSHLEEALAAEDPAEKDFHIRQALQADPEAMDDAATEGGA